MSNFPTRRVVICAPGFPSSLDDSDKPFLLNHGLALASAGFDVTVVCPSVPGLPNRQIVEGIQVTRKRYAPRRFETLATTGAMYREARGIRSIFALSMVVALIIGVLRESTKRDPVVLHGHWWVPGGLAVVLVGLFTRTQSVVHLHGSDSVIVGNFWMRWIARRVMRSATHRLAVSEELADWGRQLSSRDFEVCPMPIADFYNAPEILPPVDGPILGVGRLVKEKGFDVLIQAVAQLDELERPRIVIIGDGPERDALSNAAQFYEVKLDLLGSLPPEDVASWYLKSRYVVVPSRREGFGLVAAEAAASARAVIGSRVGSIPSLIDEGVSGLLVRPGSVSELARSLQKVDASWGSAGKELVSHLTSARHGAGLRDLYLRNTIND